MNVDAVIFDLDGLMIDSEQLHFDAWLVLLTEYERTLTDDDFQHMIGMDSSLCARYVIDRADVPLTPQDLLKRRWEIVTGLLEQGIEPVPGLLDLLAELARRRYDLAVASNSPLAYTRKALAAIGLAERFRCVLTADQVPVGKPAPDIYLAAAGCLGVTPERCLALEDSSVGLQAALAAGMRCVIVPNAAYDHSAAFDGADARFSSLGEMLAQLDRVLDNR